MAEESMGGAESTPQAATSMADIITEFNSPAPASAPAPEPVPEPVAAVTPDQPAGSDQQAEPTEPQISDWYQQFIATQDDDPFAQFMDDSAFESIRSNPAELADYATRGREFIKSAADRVKAADQYLEQAEYFNGVENTPFALSLAGDLFRGDLELEEADGSARTHVERFLNSVKERHTDTYYDLGVAILNNAPELLDQNTPFLLRRLGLNPEMIDDYKAVTQAGGFQPPEDQAAEMQWVKENLTPEMQSVYKRLTSDQKADLQKRTPAVRQNDLQIYKSYFDRAESEEREKAESQRAQEFESQNYAMQTMAESTRGVFDEYVQKGIAAGLNPLEAAGAAAMAYRHLEETYWDAKSDSRKAQDAYFKHIKSRNELQMAAGKRGYQKLFEGQWRKALSSYSPKKSTAAPPPNPAGPRPPVPPPARNGDPQFAPTTPEGAPAPPKRILDIMREFGHNV
jgi:hypothetical protein